MGGRGRSSKAADARESAAWALGAALELGNVEKGSSGTGHAACDASLRWWGLYEKVTIDVLAASVCWGLLSHECYELI